MKTLLLILVLALVGCTSAPVSVTPRHEVLANAAEDVIAIGLVPVLAKNPAYMAEARAAAAICASFAGSELRPSDVDSFVTRLKVAPEDARAIAGLINAAWGTYQRRYAEQVDQSLRPDVKLFLAAAASGINRAIAATPR